MIEYVGNAHRESAAIWAQLPDLARLLFTRLCSKDVNPLAYAELLANVRRHFNGYGSDYTLVTAGPCIVGYNMVRPWWSADTMLMEEFIIRYKPGNFADTIKALEQHAKANGCKDLVIASLAMVRQESYGEYLKRKGFREVARQYIKGV